MRKVLLISMMLISNMLTFAQGIYIDIENHPSNMRRCLGDNETFYVRAQDGCVEYEWVVDGNVIQNQSPIVITPSEHSYDIEYFGCEGFYHSFSIQYVNTPGAESFTQVVWGHPGVGITLRATIGDYNTYNWQGGGPNYYAYEVFSPGTYICEVTNPCGSGLQTFIRYDMADLTLASTDPVTGQIYLQWEVEESVAQNATELQIFRGSDTLVPIATVNYADGIWTDPDAENTAARTYRVRTVAYDGSISPISEQKQTIHMNYNLSYFDDIINLDWNIPAGYELEWFIVNQLVYTKDGPNIIAFDSVTPDINSMSVPLNKFENDGKVFIEGRVRGEKRDRLSPYSNPTDEEILGVEEYSQNSDKLFDIFPNPAKGLFTVRATGKITITTILGQVVLVQNVDGEKNIELPKGEYVVTYDGESRVIVVE